VAHKGAAAMPVYAATKAALDGFGRSLSLEWQDRVVVRVLHPGPTATGMAERAGRPADWLLKLMLPPYAVAAMVIDGLESARGYRQKLSYGRYLPRLLLREAR
jgi:short-subunit dehydrogenase